MPPAVLNAALLRDPAQRSVRVIAQARLQRVLEEAARVEVRVSLDRPGSPTEPGTDATDPEAVHDFRVALRRLRTWLRAFRLYLEDTVRRGPERRLRTLSRLAGRARDLEVQYLWLIGVRPGPAGDAARWLAEDVNRDQIRARRALGEGLVAELANTSAELAEELQHYRRDTALEEPVYDRMATAMADAVREATDTLTEDLGRVVRPAQAPEAHAARISIKRLRYLLDGLGRASRSSANILPRLIELQHLFGELHDAQVLHQLVREIRAVPKSGADQARPGADRPPPRALRALEALLARRIATRFQAVFRAGRSRATRAMFRRLSALVRRLEQAGRGRGTPGRVSPAV